MSDPTAKEFYEFFKQIPIWKWTTGKFENKLGQRCALGHVDTLPASLFSYQKREVLHRIFANLGTCVDFVNDGKSPFPDNRFPQFTSKGRILAALKLAMEKDGIK